MTTSRGPRAHTAPAALYAPQFRFCLLRVEYAVGIWDCYFHFLVVVRNAAIYTSEWKRKIVAAGNKRQKRGKGWSEIKSE